MDPSGVPLDAPSPGGPSRKKAEVDYKFCLLCSNLLYPKEDRMTNTLNYICKACGQVQPAEASCTYRNQLGSTVTETAGVTTDVANDPTVGKTLEVHNPYDCSKCGGDVTCNHCGSSLLVDGRLLEEKGSGSRTVLTTPKYHDPKDASFCYRSCQSQRRTPRRLSGHDLGPQRSSHQRRMSSC